MNRQVEAALADRDWSAAEVVSEGSPTPMSVVHSVRLTGAVSERLLAEAQRRGVTPSVVIRELVEDGLRDLDGSATVRLADVRRAIEQLPPAA